MEHPRELIAAILRTIVLNNRDILLIACSQRAKFEGWLKFELANGLRRHNDFRDIFLEKAYAIGKRSDIAYKYGGSEWFVEIKTTNTNWRGTGILNRTRPIKMNIDHVISDIRSLQDLQPMAHGLMVFVIFPVPLRIWETSRSMLNYHTQRIELEAKLRPGSLAEAVDFISLNESFGVCAYVVPIK